MILIHNRIKALALVLVLASIGFSQESAINPRYHTYEEIVAFVDSIQAMPQYAPIVTVEEIGRSTNEDLPIYALKFSDNPTVDEDEPNLLFLGQCHAEEILGVEITMGLIDTLLHGFDAMNSHIGNILQNLEVWVVPTYNPEGLRVVHDGWDVTYRKNKTDNNGNGTFDYVPGIGFDIDGVDFNRNYDFNWIFGDAYEVGDYDYYRGPAPFSELETQAVANLAKREKFLMSVAYHSARSGTPEIIYHSWEWETSKNPPDYDLMKGIAEILGTRIINESGDGNYAVTPGKTPRGNAHDWFYTQTGAVQFLIEVGTNNLQPNAAIVDGTVDRNLEGLFYLMDRSFGRPPESRAMITGIISDAATAQIIEGAQIQVGKRYADGSVVPLEGLMMQPRVTDEYGRYRRLLNQGLYQVIASAPGYRPDTLASILVSDDITTVLDLSLTPATAHPVDMFLSPIDGAYTVMRWDDFQRDTLTLSPGSHAFTWQGESLNLEISAPGRFPERRSFDLMGLSAQQVLEFSVELPADVQVVLSEAFDDLSSWTVTSGDWLVEDGILKSQTDLFYGENLESVLIRPLDLSAISDGQRLGVSIEHAYEVEWHLDTLSLEIWDSEGTTCLLKHDWFDQRYTPHDEMVFSNVPLPASAELRLIHRSDSTVGFRGWKVDALEVIASATEPLAVDNEHQIRKNDTVYEKQESIFVNLSPNPFLSRTTLEYALPSDQRVSIRVFDIRGRMVYEHQRYEVSGDRSWQWNGLDQAGHRLASGAYIMRLDAMETGQSLTQKLILLNP